MANESVTPATPETPATFGGSTATASRWRHDGVCVVGGDQLDPNTAQTPGMDRKAAINFARVGAQRLWAGTVHIHPDAKTGAHHHGPLESVIYVVKGRARMRWGEALEFTAEAGPGDFIYVLRGNTLYQMKSSDLSLVTQKDLPRGPGRGNGGFPGGGGDGQGGAGNGQ